MDIESRKIDFFLLKVVVVIVVRTRTEVFIGPIVPTESGSTN